MLSSNIALGTLLGKSETHERNSQAAGEAADAKLAEACSNAVEVAEL